MGLFLTIAYAAGNVVSAQVVTPLPPGTRPAERPLPPPEFKKPEEVPQLDLPPIPPDREKLPALIRVFVREIRITGNTVIPTDELKKVTAPFENREITNNDLEEVRRQLTLYYVNRGYINSGAVVPDQKIEDGIVQIQIVEGRLARIDVDGTKRFRPDYFRSRLQLQAGPPLNVKNLEQELQILLQNPLIDRLNAQLQPGDRPGEAVLKTEVAEAPPWDFITLFDNNLSPSLGEARLRLVGQVHNLAGRGDTFLGYVTWADGIDLGDDYKLLYQLPLNRRDTVFTVYYEKGDAVVVEEPFSALDIQSSVETASVGISHPFIRASNKTFTLAGILERRKSETTLGGVGIAFSPGVDPVTGESTVSVLRFVQDWLSRSSNQVFSARSTFNFGLDAFDSTVNNGNVSFRCPFVTSSSDCPDSEFVSWLGQLQWARRLGTKGHQLSFRFYGQLSDDPLLPIEQFSLGGLDSVRGYRVNQLVRDEGWFASLQYQFPVFRNPTGSRNLQFAVFADAGAARNIEGFNQSPSDLESYGVGFIWNPSNKLSAELYFAKAVDDVPSGGEHSIQDDGIHFRLVAHPFAKKR